MIASGGEDECVKIWYVDGEKIAELYGHNNNIHSVVFVDDDQIASCDEDGVVVLWNL